MKGSLIKFQKVSKENNHKINVKLSLKIVKWKVKMDFSNKFPHQINKLVGGKDEHVDGYQMMFPSCCTCAWQLGSTCIYTKVELHLTVTCRQTCDTT